MALIKCPECGHDVSDKAAKCPQCGYPMQSEQLQKQPQQRNKTWLWITLAFVAVAIIGGGVWFLLKNTGDDPNAIVELTPEFIEKVQKYDKLAPFSEGRAAVCRGELWGYIDTKGNEVIPCQYSRAEMFHEGLTQVVKGDEAFYINRKGKKAFEGEGGRFSEGLALLTDGRVVDANGKEKFKVNVYDMAYSMSRVPNATRYTDYPYFENGVITVYTLSDEDAAAERYENVAEHSYDKDGKMLSAVVETMYKTSYQPFSEDIDYDKEFDNGNRTGLKDVNGNLVIPAKFSEVSDIANGVAFVTLRENDAYYVISNGYDYASSGYYDGDMGEYTPRYYGYSDSHGNTTFSKETLNHIEEANRIGREKWAEKMERIREEERKSQFLKEHPEERFKELIDSYAWQGGLIERGFRGNHEYDEVIYLKKSDEYHGVAVYTLFIEGSNYSAYDRLYTSYGSYTIKGSILELNVSNVNNRSNLSFQIVTNGNEIELRSLDKTNHTLSQITKRERLIPEVYKSFFK